MSERDPTNYSRLPQWPAEAKELPEGRPRLYRSRWTGLAVGLGLGAIFNSVGLLAGVNVAFLLGKTTVWGVVGFLIGYTADWYRERQDHLYRR